MKSTRLLTVASLLIGSLLGASALVALADWSGPTGTPPSNNAAAPINVGSTAQGKIGAFALGVVAPTAGTLLDVHGSGLFNSLGILGAFVFKPTASPVSPGSVLWATDNQGTVGWVATSSLGLGGTPGGGPVGVGAGIPSAMKQFTSSQTWSIPTGVTRVRAKVWGGGGGNAGGGGGYAEAIFNVPAGVTTATVVVGGAGSASSFGISGTTISGGGGATTGPTSGADGSCPALNAIVTGCLTRSGSGHTANQGGGAGGAGGPPSNFGAVAPGGAGGNSGGSHGGASGEVDVEY